MARRADRNREANIEEEFGIPIPGEILPPDQWAKTALKKLPEQGPLDWSALFGRSAPVVLDLGCGNGRFTISSAVRRPEMDHLGLDALPVVIRYATRRGNHRGLSNVRFAVRGAYEFLEELVAPHSVTEVHLYHPQPYHNVEKAYRRLVTPEFLALVHRSLLPGGQFVIQTDNRRYWSYIRTVTPAFFEFHEQPGPWPEDPEGRTRREIIARRQGLKIFRGWGTPRPLEEAQVAKLIEDLPRPRFRTR